MVINKETLKKIEEMYQAKSLSNMLYLKEQFHKLQIKEGKKISDHFSALNEIVSELKSIGVKMGRRIKAPKRKLYAGNVGNLDM